MAFNKMAYSHISVLMYIIIFKSCAYTYVNVTFLVIKTLLVNYFDCMYCVYW